MYTKEYIQQQLQKIKDLEDDIKYLKGELRIEKENALLLYDENQRLKDQLYDKLSNL